MKLAKNLMLRIPILPLTSDKTSAIPNQEEIFSMLSVDINNEIIVEKYKSRMKYRTIPLFGMVSENNLQLGEENNVSINKIRKINFENIGYGLYTINSSINSFGYYIQYCYKNEIIQIETDGLIEKLVKIRRNEVKSRAEWLKFFNEFCEESEIVFEELVDVGFFIEFSKINFYETKNLSDAFTIDRFSTKKNQIKFSEKLILKVGNIVSKLLCNFYLSGYKDLLEYFDDIYSNKLIPVTEILNNQNFYELLDKLILKVNEEYINFFDKTLDNWHRHGNKEDLNIPLNEFSCIDGKSFFEANFDLFLNLYRIDSKSFVNLDTGKPIINYSHGNKFVSPNSYTVNILNNNNIVNYLYSSKSNNKRINYDYNSIGGVFIDDLLVGFDSSKKKLCLFHKISGERIKINLNSNLNRNYIDKSLQFLFLLSDVNNFLTIDLFSLNYNHTFCPRIIVDGNVILARKQWIIKYNSHFLKNKFDVQSYLSEVIQDKTSSLNLCLIIDDYEIKVDIDDYNDCHLLFKILKKNKFLHLKEDLSVYSILKIDEETYNNEIIASFNSDNSDNSDRLTKEDLISKVVTVPHNSDMLQQWVYFEIEIPEYSKWAYYLLYEINDVIRNCEFFYLFFILENKQFLRVRARIEKREIVFNISNVLNRSKFVVDFAIKKYEKEVSRYGSMTLNKFEKISCTDTSRVLLFYKNNPESLKLMQDETEYKMRLLVSNSLALSKLAKFNIIDIFEIYRNNGKKNRQLLDIYSKLIDSENMFLCKNNNTTYHINKLKKLYQNLTIDEVRDMIHLSNVRLVGNDIFLEKEVYEYIELVFLRKEYEKNASVFKA